MDQDSLMPWVSRDEMGRLMTWPQRMWTQAVRDLPCMEIGDDGDDLVVSIEVPGVEPDDLDIEVTAHGVTVRGETRQSSQDRGEVYHSERRYGRFQRSVTLPVAVDPEKATASFHQGLLEVRMPRAGGARKKLRVEASRTGRH